MNAVERAAAKARLRAQDRFGDVPICLVASDLSKALAEIERLEQENEQLRAQRGNVHHEGVWEGVWMEYEGSCACECRACYDAGKCLCVGCTDPEHDHSRRSLYPLPDTTEPK